MFKSHLHLVPMCIASPRLAKARVCRPVGVSDSGAVRRLDCIGRTAHGGGARQPCRFSCDGRGLPAPAMPGKDCCMFCDDQQLKQAITQGKHKRKRVLQWLRELTPDMCEEALDVIPLVWVCYFERKLNKGKLAKRLGALSLSLRRRSSDAWPSA